MDTANVTGLADLQKFMDDLPVKLEKNVMRGGLRAGMNAIKPFAMAGVHSISHVLVLGLKVSTKSSGGVVTASLKATGKHAFIAHMLEFTGAVAHWIRPKNGKALSFGGKAFIAVHNPGFQPRPFMRPALEAQAAAALAATGNYVKDRLASKYGLDTSDVEIAAS